MENKNRFLNLLVSVSLVIIMMGSGDSLADDIEKPVAESVVTGVVSEELTVMSVGQDESTVKASLEPASKGELKVEQIAANNSNGGNALYIVVVLVLALTTLLSVGISFYLYKWRKVLLENKHLVVPEEAAKHMQSLGKSVGELGQVVAQNLQVVSDESKNNSEKITNMTETYMQLHHALDEKDKEIKRLKKGYDAQIFKGFVRRFARIEQTVDDFILEDGESDQLTMLSRLFEDAFDECGVCKFSPEIGSDYRRVKGVADNPKLKKAESSEDEFKIYEVLEAGYKLVSGAEEQVVIPAKVRIFKLG